MRIKASRPGYRRSFLAAALAPAAVVAGLLPGYAAGAAVSARHAPAPVSAADPSTAGPFATLLFSRSEVANATGCVPDTTGDAAGLVTTVAPYLQSLGLTATGTLVTNRTQATGNTCTHYGDSLTASWADAVGLAQNFGWTFVSHTADYPSAAKLQRLTPAQAQAETCGSVATIAAHGLPGAAGMIAYPGGEGKAANKVINSLQQAYSENCVAWGRQYDATGATGYTAGATPPYWQHTTAVNGGPCNDPAAACYTYPVNGHDRYTVPSQIIGEIAALQPGQWFTLQAYILVNGASPPGSPIQWDCTSADPLEHWTSDEERYCWSDYQAILQAFAAAVATGLVVTDPLTVGVAFGRPATYTQP